LSGIVVLLTQVMEEGVVAIGVIIIDADADNRFTGRAWVWRRERGVLLQEEVRYLGFDTSPSS